jgi:predicted AlkP superfamily pyrophosphatase or phosphodiesterase
MRRMLLCLAAGAALALAAVPAPAREPTVLLLSLDGVRPDYLDRDELPALARVAREGLRAEGLEPVFPSSTFPNHVSLATCVHPDRHGIVANAFQDRVRGGFDYSNDASWIEAEPLWATAERQGVRAATYFWVGSETPWRGVAATHRMTPFDSDVPEAAKVDQILAWLDLPPGSRPRLVLSWWHGADDAGHAHGPDAEETRARLRGQDAELARLLAGLDARRAWDSTTLLLVSDHGMVEVSRTVDAMAALAAVGIRGRLVNGGAFAHLFLEDPTRAEEAAALLDGLEGLDAWVGGELPERLRYRHPTRTGDVFALAAPPWRIGGAASSLRDLQFALGRFAGRRQGLHGYDPASVPEMAGIFLALGRGVTAGARPGRVRALDVAPTAARLLGIEPPPGCEGAPLDAIAPPAEAVPSSGEVR